MDTVGLSKLLLVLTYAMGVLCNVQPPVIGSGILSQSRNLPECQACKVFIESFQKGLERTARGKFEGGDAAWEEEKLKKSYKRSEIRLIDIQEGLCKEESKHSVQCHHMAEKTEDFIEEWWAQNLDESANLHSYICTEKLQVCCPIHHYGKNCSPCPGDHDNLCNGHGKCRGDGTRKGNGTCLCDVGYSGENCDQCIIGYFETLRDGKQHCEHCHRSCMGGCRGGTQKDCVACKPGFSLEIKEGCNDINECDDINQCKKDEFCLNSLGSYKCLKCDKACAGCHGDGPDLCIKCAKGYLKKGELCEAEREEDDQFDTFTRTRYMTYVGLLVATVILMPKSSSLGSIVGAMVLTYIIGAEYYCMLNGYKGLLNFKEYDFSQFVKDSVKIY